MTVTADNEPIFTQFILTFHLKKSLLGTIDNFTTTTVDNNLFQGYSHANDQTTRISPLYSNRVYLPLRITINTRIFSDYDQQQDRLPPLGSNRLYILPRIIANTRPITDYYLIRLGAMMLPSRVLSYLQMGHFLMLVMTLGWAFSTFFFQALCCTIGPQGDWGQFSWSDIFSWRSMKTSEETPRREETVLLREHCEADENDNKNGTVESKIMVNNTQIKAIEATSV